MSHTKAIHICVFVYHSSKHLIITRQESSSKVIFQCYTQFHCFFPVRIFLYFSYCSFFPLPEVIKWHPKSFKRVMHITVRDTSDTIHSIKEEVISKIEYETWTICGNFLIFRLIHTTNWGKDQMQFYSIIVYSS